MPKRVIDFDAMWGSDKLAACAEWAQAEYAWLYGLADASGCFELTNLRVIWGRVAAIRRNLSIERLEQVFQEFQERGLLFVWEENGKRYGHWTGSDVPGRLPAPSWRMRLERLAPPVPRQQLAEFMSRFSRGRAASPGGGFFVEYSSGPPQGPLQPFAHGAQDKLSVAENRRRDAGATRGQAGAAFAEATAGTPGFDGGAGILPAGLRVGESENRPDCRGATHGAASGGLKAGLEAAQAQDLEGKENQEVEVEGKRRALHDGAAGNESAQEQTNLFHLNSKTEMPRPEPLGAETSQADRSFTASAAAGRGTASCAPTSAPSYSARFTKNAYRERDKSLATWRELQVGRGPECGPGSVKPEALERIRARNAGRSP